MAKGGLAFNEISLRSRENDKRRFVIIFHPILFDLLSEVGNQRRESQRFQGKATPHWFLAVTIQGRVLIEGTLCCYLLSPNYLCFGKSNGSTLFIIKPPPKLGGTPFWQNINERNHHTKTNAQGRAGERELNGLSDFGQLYWHYFCCFHSLYYHLFCL